MSRYHHLKKVIGPSLPGTDTTTAWVVHPKGGGRMALVREEDEEVWVGHGRAKEAIGKKTGRLFFLSWVDRSLETVALELGRQKRVNTMTALTTKDSRWVDASTPPLADWDANPASRNDVAMFSEGGK
jgi:hypothetical protein